MKNILSLLILVFAAFISSKPLFAQPTLEDIQYKTACGPIACFVALKTLGYDTTLPEVVNRCQWKQDEFLPLENMQKALKSFRGIDCQTVQLSPKKLCQFLEDERSVVILVMRKNSDVIDHAVCAVDVEQNRQVVKMIDYPELVRRQLIGEVADQWDGAAIVVRISPFYRACGDFAWFFGPFVIFFFGFVWFHSRMKKRNCSMNGLYYLFCLYLIVAFASCSKKEENTMSLVAKPIVSQSSKSTLQRSFFLKHDFGILDAGKEVSCSIDLKNDTDKPIDLVFNQVSCGGCFKVEKMPDRIEPDATGVIELMFNTTGKRGLTPQQAVLWDTEPKTLVVVIDTTAVVRSFWVNPGAISLGSLTNSVPFKTKMYVMAAGYPNANVTAETDVDWITLTSNKVATSNELENQAIKAIGFYEVDWIGDDVGCDHTILLRFH